jgi:hypothetical protein
MSIVLDETTGLVHHRTSRFASDALREETICLRAKNQFPLGLGVADAVFSIHYRKGEDKGSVVRFFEILVPSHVTLNNEIENDRFILDAPAGTLISRRNADKTQTRGVRIDDAIDDIEVFAEFLPDR